ncbi:MOSC domain-containing protein [Pseudactinotalea sp. Z1748]|uniref:MOSC domain-containing protein n=1 Tax=Pseudactinotalea sp. Z1748 TaxID=3413027 RepID=UPI003C797296
MPHVAALYRYPVKGFTPEAREQLTIQPDGRVAGDRVLAFRFADAAEPEDADGLAYWPKQQGLALVNFPSLARLRLTFDGQTLRIDDGAESLVTAGLDRPGRALITARITEWLQQSPDARRLRRPGVLPLVLVGDGGTSRFQDRPRGYVSAHGAASTRALGQVLPGGGDDRRFRSNIVISGTQAWEELEWTGRVSIGTVQFEVSGPIGRCLATHANPDNGRRDAEVLTALVTGVGQSEPRLGVLLLPAAGGGTISVGDPVTTG